MTKEDIIKALEKMTIAELNDLVKTIEDHFGVVAAAAIATADSGKASEEESNEVNVVLTELGQSKVAVIKLVGKLTGKGLMEAKKALDKLPFVVKEKVNQEEADDLKNQFTEVGATVELK